MYLLLLLGVAVAAAMMANRGLASPSLLQAWPASTFAGGPAFAGGPSFLAGIPGPGSFVALIDMAHHVGSRGSLIVVQVTGTGVATPSGSTVLPGVVTFVLNPPEFTNAPITQDQTVLFNVSDAVFAAPDLATAHQMAQQVS